MIYIFDNLNVIPNITASVATFKCFFIHVGIQLIDIC